MSVSIELITKQIGNELMDFYQLEKKHLDMADKETDNFKFYLGMVYKKTERGSEEPNMYKKA